MNFGEFFMGFWRRRRRRDPPDLKVHPGGMELIEDGFTEGEDVAEHLETAKLFRDFLRQSEKGLSRAPPTLARAVNAKLAQNPLGEINLRHRFRMAMIANSLIAGMWLQLAQKLSGSAKFRFCELCGAPFEVGPGTGRRGDAQFCSDTHRIEFNSRKRTKGP